MRLYSKNTIFVLATFLFLSILAYLLNYIKNEKQSEVNSIEFQMMIFSPKLYNIKKDTNVSIYCYLSDKINYLKIKFPYRSKSYSNSLKNASFFYENDKFENERILFLHGDDVKRLMELIPDIDSINRIDAENYVFEYGSSSSISLCFRDSVNLIQQGFYCYFQNKYKYTDRFISNIFKFVKPLLVSDSLPRKLEPFYLKYIK